MIRRLCVFAGSSRGADPRYAAAATALGRALGARGIGLVYGGGSVGLMGVLADAVMAAGGEAIGVIPRALATAEIAHAGLSRLHVVGSMHERKALMAELADGFVALPGGFGTFEELLEVITWAQLGLHAKPIAVLDVAGYFRGLSLLVDHAVAEGFVHDAQRDRILRSESVAELLDQLAAFRPAARVRRAIAPEDV